MQTLTVCIVDHVLGLAHEALFELLVYLAPPLLDHTGRGRQKGPLFVGDYGRSIVKETCFVLSLHEFSVGRVVKANV